MNNIEIPLNTRNRPIQITVDKNIYSCKFENETTEYWNEHSAYVPSRNEIVVFSDYITTQIGLNIPGIKIGDGSTNVIDLPFANSSTGEEFIRALEEHEANDVVHTTQAEKDIWNGKADADDLVNHEADTVVHTTQAEKDIWNGKADADDLVNHEADTVVHTTQAEKDIWNGKADADDLANHEADMVVHTTQAEKDIWNDKADLQDIEDLVISQATQPTGSSNKIWLKPNGQDLVLAEISDLANHEADTVVHTTQAEKDIWNGKADADDLVNHEADTVIHTTQAEKDIWNGKADISVVANGLVITLPS